MKCIRCQEEVKNSNYCSKCGCDLRYYKNAIKCSNYYYNNALVYIKNNNKSKAIKFLRRSILYNNHNIDALNLLGLIYLSIGEHAVAISYFILSLNYKNDKNKAKTNLDELQNDKLSLDYFDEIVAKYNESLYEIDNSNIEKAKIILEEIISKNTAFLDAKILLSLIYINENNFKKASSLLEDVLKIDTGNEKAIYYLSIINNVSPISIYNKYNIESKLIKEGIFFRTKRLRKEKGYFYIMIGGILSFLFTWFLLFPIRARDEYNRLNNTIIEDYNELKQLEEEKNRLQEKIKELESEENTESADTIESSTENSDNNTEN